MQISIFLCDLQNQRGSLFRIVESIISSMFAFEERAPPDFFIPNKSALDICKYAVSTADLPCKFFIAGDKESENSIIVFAEYFRDLPHPKILQIV